MKTIIVTGGAGFIGSGFVLSERLHDEFSIVNIDLLTYAANPLNLDSLSGDPRYTFIKGDIGDRALVREVFRAHRPFAVVNMAAESHVDRSIVGPGEFIRTNVVGTFHLLEEARSYWEGLQGDEKRSFRFLHISTDEVYGSLGPRDPAFQEQTPYSPNSPYSASKAAGDHLVRAYHHTYGLPTLTTNCSNNYGPRQFPEKLIPLMILNATRGKSLPIYGDGLNIRDWIHVQDHCDALHVVLNRGSVGEVFNVGGCCEKTNIEVVNTICDILDELIPDSPYRPHRSLVTFVKDRLGHDRRYAVDSSKIQRELGWRPKETFESGLRKTILWYLENKDWVDSVETGAYRRWIEQHYGSAVAGKAATMEKEAE